MTLPVCSFLTSSSSYAVMIHDSRSPSSSMPSRRGFSSRSLVKQNPVNQGRDDGDIIGDWEGPAGRRVQFERHDSRHVREGTGVEEQSPPGQENQVGKIADREGQPSLGPDAETCNLCKVAEGNRGGKARLKPPNLDWPGERLGAEGKRYHPKG